MNRIEKLNMRQDEAVTALIENNGIGTLNMATGTGKTITFLKCLYAILDLGWIDRGCTVRFLAEVDNRKYTLQEEIDEFKKLFKKDANADFDIKFFCYAGVYENIGQTVDVYDELHDTLTAKYYRNIKESAATYKIGLSATIPEDLNVFREKIAEIEGSDTMNFYQDQYFTDNKEITKFITKGQLAEILCPVVYRYPLSMAIEDGVLSPFETYIVSHHLDASTKNIKTWKSYDVLGSEYDYYDKRDRKRRDFRIQKYIKAHFAREMTRLLYNLPSKVEVVKSMLKLMKDRRVILFGVELKVLKEITPNVCEAHNTKELIDKFNAGEINVIASARRLKQGITLKGADACILVSYYSKSYHLEQIVGRLVRFVPEKIGKVFIIRTERTFEATKWFAEMQRKRNHEGKVVGKFELNVKQVLDSRNIVLKAKQ